MRMRECVQAHVNRCVHTQTETSEDIPAALMYYECGLGIRPPHLEASELFKRAHIHTLISSRKNTDILTEHVNQVYPSFTCSASVLYVLEQMVYETFKDLMCILVKTLSYSGSSHLPFVILNNIAKSW